MQNMPKIIKMSKNIACQRSRLERKERSCQELELLINC